MDSRTIHVLIVDDEDRFRATTTTILQKRGFDVKAVASGFEAIEEVKKGAYEIVILDVKMPGMDGNQVLREIRKIRPETKVIMLTGHASPDSALAGLKDGIYDYLCKPCNIELLTRKIIEAHARGGKLKDVECTVGDIMVPLSTFSRIRRDAPVKKAVAVILQSFNRAMFSGTVAESVHRSILVMDERDRVIGVMSFTDLLRGVQPPYMRLMKKRPLMADNVHIEPGNFSGMFTIMVREMGEKKVGELMSEAPALIHPKDNLMAAANKLLELNARRLLVTEGDEAVGVIREQDLFFEIANILRDQGGGAK